MPITGKAVVLPDSGKRCVLYDPAVDGLVAVYDGDGNCAPCCNRWHWFFTDEGLIDGGQDGAKRQYRWPSEVPAPPWSVTLYPELQQFTIDWYFERDSNCYSHNSYTQYGTLLLQMWLRTSTRVTVEWSGTVSTVGVGYEYMYTLLGGSVQGTSASQAGTGGCYNWGAPSYSPDPPVLEYDAEPGWCELWIEVNSIDDEYHDEDCNYHWLVTLE